MSNVTDMALLFKDESSFNQPLNKWDVSNVRNMSRMFLDASSFNQPLNKWNVSKVTGMGFTAHPLFWSIARSRDGNDAVQWARAV